MKLFQFILILAVSGCSVGKVSYYEPEDSEYLNKGNTCGFVPYSNAGIEINSGAYVGISMKPFEQTIGLSMQVALNEGETVQFESSVIKLEKAGDDYKYSAPLSQFQLSVYGSEGVPGHHEYFDASSTLEGKRAEKRDLFRSTVEFQTIPADSVYVTIPPILVNGTKKVISPMKFNRVKKTAVYTCVQ